MRVIWKDSPITASQVLDRLTQHDPSWHPKTVRTLLARLVQKGALRYEERGRAYVYSPLVTEQESVAVASESFLGRVFGGSLKPMLAYFVEQQRVTKQDLADLSEMLEGREASNRNTRRRNK